jgi:ABC-type phosphate transport system auxiliary subunit
VNHTASTNGRILPRAQSGKPYNATSIANNTTRMSQPSHIDQITERVERLLLRYAELQRTNGLLAQQVEGLVHERDSLKSRLSAARARVDALLERLPENNSTQKDGQ